MPAVHCLKAFFLAVLFAFALFCVFAVSAQDAVSAQENISSQGDLTKPGAALPAKLSVHLRTAEETPSPPPSEPSAVSAVPPELAASPPAPAASPGLAQVKPRQKKPSWFLSGDSQARQKWAVIPSPSHNETYGWMGSVRAFIYPTGSVGYYTAASGTVSEEGLWSAGLSYQFWKANGEQLSFYALYDGFSDPYYGEGNNTLASDLQFIPSHKAGAGLQYVFKLGRFLYGGGFTGFQYREETSSKPLFPIDSSARMGLILYYDSRDNFFNPGLGEYYSVRSWFLTQSPSPLFLEGDARVFLPLFKGVMLAQRGQMGLALLAPAGYVFRFSLGGPQKLRGFQLNRFRGDSYYLSQTEIRISPFRFLTLAGFMDLGAAGDSALTELPHLSYGGGVRLGFPPNYSQKLRIEFGIGEDQTNVIIAFSHPF